MLKNKFLIFMACALAVFTLNAGCGIKGPPLPPLDTIQTSEVNAGPAKATDSLGSTQNPKPATAPASGDSTIKK